MRLALQRARGDCGIAALATLLEQSYEDVYFAVSKVETKARGKSGLQLAQVIKAARSFGVTLTRKARPDLDVDDGLLVVIWQPKVARSVGYESHLVALAHGVIADPADGVILPAGEYLIRAKGRAGSLLEVA